MVVFYANLQSAHKWLALMENFLVSSILLSFSVRLCLSHSFKKVVHLSFTHLHVVPEPVWLSFICGTPIYYNCLSAFFWYSEYILNPNGFPNMAKKYIFCFMFHWIKNFIQVWKTGEEVNYGKIYLWSIPLMISIGAQHWFPMKLIKDFWWKINYQLPQIFSSTTAFNIDSN